MKRSGRNSWGLGKQLGVVVHEVGASHQMSRGAVCPAADLDRLDDLSWDREQEDRLVA